MNMKIFFVTQLMLFMLMQSASGAPTDKDPYNALIWNRGNVNAQNGEVDRGDWYEWWYYKVVDPKSGDSFFFTYGVLNPWDVDRTLAGTLATIQVGSFNRRQLVTNHFPVTEFSARYDKTSVNVGGNLATDKRIQGHVIEQGHEVSWDIAVKKNWRFEAMGWSMKIPDMSGIYWYPAQASATMNGWIRFDGVTIDLKDAPGYQDRNWGRNFPKWWTWLVSSNFKNSPGTVLAAGGGEPKLFNSVYLFAGLCVGLKHKGKEYIFRTTDGHTVNFDIGWGVWSVSAQNNSGQKIEISAYAPPEKFMLLKFPSPQGGEFYDYEALQGQMNVKIYERSSLFDSWHLVDELNTDEAGIEWGTPEPIDSSSSMDFAKLFSNRMTLQ